MACVFGEMRTLKTGWRWGQKPARFGKKHRTSYRTCGRHCNSHLAFGLHLQVHRLLSALGCLQVLCISALDCLQVLCISALDCL